MNIKRYLKTTTWVKDISWFRWHLSHEKTTLTSHDTVLFIGILIIVYCVKLSPHNWIGYHPLYTETEIDGDQIDDQVSSNGSWPHYQIPQQPPASSKCPFGFPQIKVTTSPLKRSQLNQPPFKVTNVTEEPGNLVPGVSPTPTRPSQEFDSSTSSTSGWPGLWDTILLASIGLVETPNCRADTNGTGYWLPGLEGFPTYLPPKGKLGKSSSTQNPIP